LNRARSPGSAKVWRGRFISRRVAIGVCDQLAAPVLIGILRPVILLPTAALNGWTF
jgi:hypothetical protein